MPRLGRVRLTVRAKLTLLYGGLFLVAGILLLAITYGLVARSVDLRPAGGRVVISERPAPDPASASASGEDVFQLALPEPVDTADRLALLETIEEFRRDVRAGVLRRFLVQSGYALAVMAIGSIGLGWAVAGRVLAPVHQMTATARRASRENLHERIRLDGPEDELKELGDTLDAMLDRLEAAFESQRRFVADASHELRTPLALMRTEVDVTLTDPTATPGDLRAMAQRVRAATERSERLIESLLVLARSDRGVLVREPVDVAEVAGRVTADAVDFDGRGLRVETALGPVVVDGDRALIERLVANLVDNAVRHNVEDGWVRVETGDGGLRVAGSGEQIDPAQVDELFEPFRRTGAARTRSARGAGLGLAIVRSVANAHGGSATGRALPEGGLEVEVRFPEAAARPSPG